MREFLLIVNQERVANIVCRISGATDAYSLWPLAWASKNLKKVKLTTLEAMRASSWHLEYEENDPDRVGLMELDFAAIPSVQHLDLSGSSLRVRDLEGLLRACPDLQTFICSSITEQAQDVRNLSPGKMIELLEPLKDTLKILSLDLDITNYENLNPTEPDLIDSRTHFSALRILDTTPEMWSVQLVCQARIVLLT